MKKTNNMKNKCCTYSNKITPQHAILFMHATQLVQ